MINYIEKGIELHQFIEEQGYRLWQEDGEWFTTDDVAVQALIDAFDPVQYFREKAEVDSFYLRLVFLHAGLLGSVDFAVGTMSVEDQFIFQNKPVLRRNSSSILHLISEGVATDLQMDEFFKAAAVQKELESSF
jgi:hypothetical protein